MKILVTGGYGFIGSHLVERLIKENHSITIIDDFSTAKESDFTDNVTLFKIGVEDPKCEKIFADFKFDVVVHLAFKELPKEGEREYDEIYHNNSVGLQNILFFSQKYFVDKVIVISSYQVYGNQNKFPIDENSRIDMESEKVGSYLEREYFCKKYLKKGLNVVVLRLGSVYGPRQPKNFIQNVISKEYEDKSEKVTIINQKKDYIYISDVVEAIYKTCERPTSNILNISSASWMKQSEIQEIIEKNIKSKNKPIFNYIDKHTRPKYLLDNQKASLELEWSPKYSLEEGIKKTIDWSIKNLKSNKSKAKSEEESLFSILKTKWFLSTAHKYIENFILFIIFALLMIILERRLFINIDLFIIYIVMVNIYYGWWQGVISVLLSITFYMGLNQDYGNIAMIDIFNNMNQNLYIAMYIVLGGITGYLADRMKVEKSELQSDLELVEEELYFTIGMYNKSIEIKNSLQETIESNEESLGKIFSIISRLNNAAREDILSEAAIVFSQMLKTESVHIYHVDSKKNIRIASVRGNIKYHKSLIYEDYNFLETVIESGNVFINKDFIKEYPMVCAPIIKDDLTIAIVLLDGLEFNKLTYQFLNTLKILTYLVTDSMGKADKCERSTQDERYLRNTLIMKKDCFDLLIKEKQMKLSENELPVCLLVFKKDTNEKNVKLYDKLKKILSESDYIGEVDDTKIAILLINKNQEDVIEIESRLKALGISDTHIEPLRRIM